MFVRQLLVWMIGMPAALAGCTAALAGPAPVSADPDAWATAIEAHMTDAERFQLLHGFMALKVGKARDWPEDVVPGAGYVAGIPRLGIPSLRETDASMGVTNPGNARPGDTATALPAAIALGATFNPELARQAGAVVATEARAKGFNVLLGGGINLMRDPRGGRNFEYISEDPWLSGVMGGEAVKGTQAQGVISTVKHFSLNSNETNRHFWNAVIDPAAHRESDLLAFEIAIERGRPGSVMCAYNLVNGARSCGNDELLNKTLKVAWGYPGWVMSDWGAVDDWTFAVNGLDQQSGDQIDKQVWLGDPLRKAVEAGRVPRARISDMVRRILRSMRAVGIDDQASRPAPDMAAHAATALEIARQGIVLLKNDGVLPLAASAKRIAVIGGQANVGVLSGGGSALVTPPGGFALSIPYGGGHGLEHLRVARYLPSSPLDELRKALPNARIAYDPGLNGRDAARQARDAEVAIVFVSRLELEGFDSADLSLPLGQDDLIYAVAAANPNTIVVLETGNPVAMPWLDKVKGLVAAWYPGQEGGRAIAEILSGAVNPSGRTPITFPASEAQLPRPEIPSYGTEVERVDVRLDEGADVGYRWFARKGLKPLFAFGHGLSYTNFAYDRLRLSGGKTVRARFTVANTGERAGAEVAQLYLKSRNGAGERRLLGFMRVDLPPKASREVALEVDPRLLANFDGEQGQWRIDGGAYSVVIGRDAGQAELSGTVTVERQTFGR
jgi:beta-glucosidase